MDPMPHQRVGIERIVAGLCSERAAFLLADEMGIGKTLQAVHAARVLAARGVLVNDILVCCPASIVAMWTREMTQVQCRVVVVSHTRFRDMYTRYISEVMDSSAITNEEMARFITGRGAHVPRRHDGELMHARSVLLSACARFHTPPSRKRRRADNLEAAKGIFARRWGLFVLDEAHAVCSANSKLAAATAFLQTARRLALSATPVLNGSYEIIPLLRNALGAFHIHPGATARDVRSYLAPIWLRRTKHDIKDRRDAPRQDTVEVIEWGKGACDSDAARMYAHLQSITRHSYAVASQTTRAPSTSRAEWRKQGTMVVHNFFAHIHRLRQICIHPRLPEFIGRPEGVQAVDHVHLLMMALRRACPALYGVPELRAKILRACTPILPSAKMRAFWRMFCAQPRDTKFIVVCSFRGFFYHIMAPWLSGLGVRHRTLCGETRARQNRALAEFRTPALGVRVLLVVKSTGAFGLNLQDAASVCVVMDPHFNAAVDDQATHRIDRIGQLRPVVIQRYLMADSIDVAIRDIQVSKQTDIDALFALVDGAADAASMTIEGKRPAASHVRAAHMRHIGGFLGAHDARTK